MRETESFKHKLIVSFVKQFRLFKAPYRIGDLIEYQKFEYLIIGIERVELIAGSLRVTYTCQNTSIEYSLPEIKREQVNGVEAIYAELDILSIIEKRNKLFNSYNSDLVTVGRVFQLKDGYYRYHSFTDLVFESKVLRIDMLAELITPMTNQDARKQLIDRKRKKLKLTLV